MLCIYSFALLRARCWRKLRPNILPLCLSCTPVASCSRTNSDAIGTKTISTMSSTSTKRVVRGVIFDMDGTLTLHGAIDFARMKARVGIARDADVLTAIAKMGHGTPEAQRALEIVEEEERAGLERVELQPGLTELLDFCCSAGLRRGILTRNAQFAVDHFIDRLVTERETGAEGDESKDGAGGGGESPLKSSSGKDGDGDGDALFHTIITRDFTPCKPHPAPILHICKEWGLKPQETIMVGDFKDDMACGRAAGACTVLLLNNDNAAYKPLADHTIDNLAQLIPILKPLQTNPTKR